MKMLLSEAGFNEIQVTKAYEFDSQPLDQDGIVFFCANS